MLRKYVLDILIRGLVASGVITLVALALILSAIYQPEILPIVVPSLVTLLGMVIVYYFAKASNKNTE